MDRTTTRMVDCVLVLPANLLPHPAHSPLQVLDDSTDWATRQLVDDKVVEWRERGVQVGVLRRTHRQGYKAGALHKGMEALQDCKYVAVFDADFRPEADFLVRGSLVFCYCHVYFSAGIYCCTKFPSHVFNYVSVGFSTRARHSARRFHGWRATPVLHLCRPGGRFPMPMSHF